MVEISPSGQVARCAEKRIDAGTLDGFTVTVVEFGEVEGLPEPQPGIIYITSAIILAKVSHRRDVFAPGQSGTPALL
jgi:hypothetical protein